MTRLLSRIAAPVAAALLAAVCLAPSAARADGDETTREGSAIAKAIANQRLNVAPSVGEDGRLSVSYSFNRTSEAGKADWIWVRRAERVALADPASESSEGLSVGAGNRNAGKVVYPVKLGAPCSFSLDFYCYYNGAGSFMQIAMLEPKPGKGLAVDWGRRLTRLHGRRVRAPKGEKPARESIKAGNNYRMRVRVDAKGNLTATVNGMRLLDRPLAERDLRAGFLGFEIHDARIVIRSIEVEGKVSETWAKKAAKKRRRR